MREPYEEERKLKDDSEVIREVNDQINHHIENAKCRLAELNDFTPLALFKLFDRKTSGFLTVGDISYGLGLLRVKHSTKQAQDFLLQHDLNRDGYLSYNEV